MKAFSIVSRRVVGAALSKRGVGLKEAAAILIAAVLLGPGMAQAQDATWSGATDNIYNTNTNWIPATVPTGTAFFGASAQNNLSFSAADTTVGGWTFNAGASSYTFAISAGQHLTFNSAGIIINGGSASLTNAGLIVFDNSSTAGGASITTNAGGFLTFNTTSNAGAANLTVNASGEADFNNSSSAANSIININGSSAANFGLVNFNDTSTAGNATINNNAHGRLAFNNNSTAGSAAIVNASLINFNNTSTAGNANITTNAGGFLTFNTSSDAGTATLTINASGEADFNNSSSAANSTININGSSIANFGLVNFNDTSTAGNATINNNAHGHLAFNNSSTAGNATVVNGSLINFNNTSTAGNAIITNNLGSFLNFNNSASAGNSAITVNNGGEVDFYNTSTAGAAAITNNSGGLLNFRDSSTASAAMITTNSGATTSLLNSASGGSARFVINGTGVLDISQLTTASTTAGSIEGDGDVRLGSKNLAAGGNNLSTTFSGILQDGGAGGGVGGSLTKTGTGTLTLSGANAYTGATSVDSGTLLVNGSIASSSLASVNSGGTLGGIGTLPSVVVESGGALSPGNNAIGTLTVNGNLTFNNGSAYVVQVSPAAAARTNITGSASLAGTVRAEFASGSYLTRSYTILSAAGGLGGTTFNTLTNSNLPAGFVTNLSYTPTDVLLNLTATLGVQQSLAQNQQNVANAINTFFNNGGTLPPNFGALFNLTGSNLATALSQVSGEAATQAQLGAFQLMDEFLGVMTAPFENERVNTATSASAFANGEAKAFPADVAKAYAAIVKAPPPAAPALDRWSVWAAPFGGYNTTGGDAAIGSHDVNARTYGGAAGLSYHVTPDSLVGFALAGGGTNWDLEQGLGGGRSDAFLAGLYGKTHFGAAYVKAAIAFANFWASTDRYAFAGDHLTADFNAYSFAGRVEGGYRFGTVEQAIIPYAALQAQSFHLPGYSETDVTGGGFGLDYAGRTATDTRTELGARFDQRLFVNPEAVLNLRVGLAWAHDWVTDPTLTASFQALPGTSFIVTGATAPEDSALVSASAELQLASGVSLLGKFEGDFGGNSQTYSGAAVLRYTW